MTNPEPRRITIDHDGLSFDVLVDGPEDGVPVVLLHGFPQISKSWRHVMPVLAAAGYRVFAPDQRGYSPGARPGDVFRYDTATLTSDALAFVDATGGEQVHLVGHDWGGAIAWQVAGRHPERLLSVSVLSTPHPAAFAAALAGELGGDQPERSGYIDMLRSDGFEDAMFADGAALFRAVFTGSGMSNDEAELHMEALNSPEAMRGPLNWYRAADLTFTDGLGPITVPTLYVWSTEDIALGREAAEATGDHVEGPYRFEVLEGVDHWIPDHAAQIVNRLLIDHLATTDR